MMDGNTLDNRAETARPAPKRIALWGYGQFGKRLLEAIQSNWRDAVVVTAVFDRSVTPDTERMLEGGVPLLAPEHAQEQYRNGRFEAIVVSIANQGKLASAQDQIEALGIPHTTLLKESAFRPPEEFEGAKTTPLPLGFEAVAYPGLHAFYSPMYQWQTPIYFFDGTGRIPRDQWYLEYLEYETCLLNPAMPTDVCNLPVVELPGEYCSAVILWSKNYWHFTFQALPQITVMELAGYTGKYLLARNRFIEDLVTLLGVDLERVLWVDDLDPNTVYRFERLLIVRHEADVYDSRPNTPVPLEAAKRIEAAVEAIPPARGSYPSHLFVKRIGSRRLLGIEEILDEYGFETVVPEELSVVEQIRHFMRADIVLTPHGANSSNSIYMRPGTVFIEAFSKSWALPLCVQPLKAKGVDYLPLVQTPIFRDVKSDIHRDFHVDRTILRMLIETAEKLVGIGDAR